MNDVSTKTDIHLETYTIHNINAIIIIECFE